MREREILASAEEARAVLEAAGRPEITCNVAVRATPDISLARRCDHTLLRTEATADQYLALCEEALQMQTRSVCVPPDRVELCARALAGSSVGICAATGFPSGYQSTPAVVADVQMTRTLGATEFELVIPIGRLRDGDLTAVYDVVHAVLVAADGRIVAAVLETPILLPVETIRAAVAALHAGAAVLTTSTGCGPSVANLDTIALLRLLVGENRGVKAVGGIAEAAHARACIEAGADRIGSSLTSAILSVSSGGELR